MSDLTGAAWRKSSRSSSQGNCVEVAANIPGLVAVRDSKDREGATLLFTSREWHAFLGSAIATR
ncbi:DUF397 domain-containing protein [Micromonospora sp. NBC_01813]|uniref:DUF397 domain-containing protein n=1 Tax=Micromonospora sp. NBC_01813 TaxID=2975988 RepID=UPI002DDAFAFE|nr:DUF397 domain-containing protein [Micromonospora sp. NBC_01813]WSA09810.1 DUF397 domain-containing protein [Micromonospora sp. NBC_01813]